MSLSSSHLSPNACCTTATRKNLKTIHVRSRKGDSDAFQSHLRIKDDGDELFDSIYSAQTSNYFFIEEEERSAPHDAN
jgi:hypothetical protein